MRHHILYLLEDWFPRRDHANWLLATVINVKGSSYRKAGAMMLLNDQGEHLGMVSGGCLESDIMVQARKCWLSGKSRQIDYDMSEEGDVAWRLGIGCGGAVRLLLQPIHQTNDYLHLDKVLNLLLMGDSVNLMHWLKTNDSLCSIKQDDQQEHWFSHQINPPKQLLILGGGADAIPLAKLAHSIGWQVSVNDARPRYARTSCFKELAVCSSLQINDPAIEGLIKKADAVVIMHHHLKTDAQALVQTSRTKFPKLKYLSLLGPHHRTFRVLQEAGLSFEDLPLDLQSPAGFDLGGELPESIALAILAQAHAAVFDKAYKYSREQCQLASA